jgi:hypothetical protein
MKYRIVHIMILFFSLKTYSQYTCIVNGSIPAISSICLGQTVSLSTNTLNYSCYPYGYLPTNLQNSLVSYYPFCGNFMDYNPMNSYDFGGTSGPVSLTIDRFGNSNDAYDFGGNSSMQGGGGFPGGNSARTITLWFYDRVSLSTGPDSVASNIFCYGLNNINNTFFQILHMSPSNGGYMKIDFLGSNITSTVAAGFNSWQFFAFVLDASSNYTTYVNGTASGTGTLNINTATPAAAWLGCSLLPSAAPRYYFNGKIDEIFIYSRDLSSTEIMQLYNVNMLPTTYSWSTGATTSSIVVSPSVSTVYTLSATNGFYSCTASSTVNVSTCIGIEELSTISSFQIYPNPVVSKLYFKPEIEISLEGNIEIENILGEKVLSLPYSKEIDVSKLTPGIYILNLSQGNKRLNYHFVKE